MSVSGEEKEDEEKELFRSFNNLQISQGGKVSNLPANEVSELDSFCHMEGNKVVDTDGDVLGYRVYVPLKGYSFCRVDSDVAKGVLARKKEREQLEEKHRDLPCFPSPP